MAQSILLITLEFPTWKRAKHLSYCAQLGLEEGLTNENIKFFTLPSVWIHKAKDLLKGQNFDQVWFELIQTPLSDSFLQWLRNHIPIRVGFLLESATYTTTEYQQHPFIWGRYNLIKSRIRKSVTHLVACDENDKSLFPESFWCPQTVPQRYITTQIKPLTASHAIFCGAVYAERAGWFKNPGLKNILVRQHSSESKTEYPAQFDQLHRQNFLWMNPLWPIPPQRFSSYMEKLRIIRRQCFSLWLNNMSQGCAVVNLPHMVKTYSGRVVEAMAAGIPVISWGIPNRPQNNDLFIDGKEIILFSMNDPQQLINAIEKLKNSSQLRTALAKAAQQKVLKYHTTEKRVGQILEWIENKKLPQYHD